MADRRPTCRTYEVDGQPVIARSTRPLTEKDLAALAEFRELLKAQARLKAAAVAVRQALEQKEAPGG